MALAHASTGTAEAAEVQRLLASVPASLLAGAFGGEREALLDGVLRALLGAPANRRFDAAKHDLMTTLAWRRALHVDQLLTRDVAGCAAFRAAWPSTLCGPDAAGNVVWLDRLADINIHALAALPPAALAAGRAQQLEAVQARKRRAPPGMRQSEHTYVLDCAGGGLPLTPATWRVLREVTAIGHLHYGMTLRRCFVVNAHPAARLAWGALRVIIHPDTVARVRIVADVAELRRLAAADGLDVQRVLPASLGGACADATPLVHDIAELHRTAHTAKAGEAFGPPTPSAAPELVGTAAPPPPLPVSPRHSKHMKRQRSNTSVGGAHRGPREPPRKG